MAKSSGKQTKKFVQGGHLSRTIKDRKRKQDVKKKIDNRRALRDKTASKGGRSTQQAGSDDDEEDDDAPLNGAAAEDDQDDVEM
jgi:hypothetical protein